MERFWPPIGTSVVSVDHGHGAYGRQTRHGVSSGAEGLIVDGSGRGWIGLHLGLLHAPQQRGQLLGLGGKSIYLLVQCISLKQISNSIKESRYYQLSSKKTTKK